MITSHLEIWKILAGESMQRLRRCIIVQGWKEANAQILLHFCRNGQAQTSKDFELA